MRNRSRPMSQKPTASRIAMVVIRELAITGFSLRAGAFGESLLGAGGKPSSNGGPLGARLVYRGARSAGWDAARVGRKLVRRGTAWRAEVGPMLPGDHPRPPGFAFRRRPSFECLVFAEIRDGH